MKLLQSQEVSLMDSISLASYSIRIKNKKDDNFLELNRLTTQELLLSRENPIKDLFNVLKTAFKEAECNERSAEYNEKSNQKIISVEFSDSDLGDRRIYGRVDYGPYGKAHKAKNTENDEEKPVPITKKTAVTDPYYFLLVLPEEEERGILILERKGNVGIKNTFEKWLKETIFKDILFDYQLVIEPYLPKKVWNAYFDKGEIIAFDFNEIHMSRDGIDKLNPNLSGINGPMRIRLKVENKSSSKAKRYLKKALDKGDNSFIEIFGETSNFRAEIKLNGKIRIFDIDGESIYPYMDISNEVIPDKNGHPEFEVIHTISVEHAKDLLKSHD